MLERVACIALRRPEPTAESSPPGERKPGTGFAFSPSGGGRFLVPGRGARRVGTGFGSGAGVGSMGTWGSWSDLKLRFVRRGVEVNMVVVNWESRAESYTCCHHDMVGLMINPVNSGSHGNTLGMVGRGRCKQFRLN